MGNPEKEIHKSEDVMMKFRLEDAREFGFQGIKGYEYNTKEEFPNASVVFAEVSGRHGKIKNVKSDRIYIIVEGKGEFVINEMRIPVKEKDVIIVPKNTPYDYKGRMKIFLVDTPSYEKGADIKLE